MKTESEKRNIKIFLGALAFVALFINFQCMRLAGQFGRYPVRRPAPVVAVPNYAPPVPHTAPRTPVEQHHQPQRLGNALPYRPPQHQPHWQPLPSAPYHPPQYHPQRRFGIAPPAPKWRFPQSSAPKPSPPKPVESAADKLAKYRAQYLNASVSRKPGVEMLAVAVTSDGKKWDLSLTDALSRRFRAKRVMLVPRLFKPAFISDGLFDDLFGGATDALGKLGLANSLDGLLLARKKTSYTRNAAVDNLVSAHITLEVTLVPVSAGVQDQSWSFQANGAGFSHEAAHSMAEERLTKQIARDTNMTLAAFSPNQTSK